MDRAEKSVPEDDKKQKREVKESNISRRGFLKAAGAAAVASAGFGAMASGCQPEAGEAFTAGITNGALPTSLQYPAVPYPPVEPIEAGTLNFFTPHEALTTVALTSRILPGTPEDPGAREAGVVYYIDNLLSVSEGFNEPTYRHPPYVQAYKGDSPAEEAESGEFQVIWVPADEIERYGYQSILTPREVFRLGLAYVDRYANEQFGSNFVDLTEADQDTIIDDMVHDRVTGFERLSGNTFFHVLRRYTSEGMFSDPAYGGNRDMVGWKLIGYPGAQRAYTPDEIVELAEPPRPPQSLAQLHAFHPGQPTHPNIIEVVRGTGLEPPEGGE
ncbi:MAG TPA: gluconate 2-dehydrogenase subunit 3 family protein [Anaerolineae bacterium]